MALNIFAVLLVAKIVVELAANVGWRKQSENE